MQFLLDLGFSISEWYSASKREFILLKKRHRTRQIVAFDIYGDIHLSIIILNGHHPYVN